MENNKSIKKLACTAYDLVKKYFNNAKDKGGKPYIEHLYRVAESVAHEQEHTCSNNSTLNLYYDKCYIVALLHDIIEDTSCSAAQLRTLGFDDEIIAAVVAMTKRHDEKYLDYIERVSNNDIARKVKIHDLEDNMDIKRLCEFSDKDAERIKKYWYCWKFLKGEISIDACRLTIYGEKIRTLSQFDAKATEKQL